MKISINWLKEYIQTESNPVEISEILTNLGLEVEKIDSFESVKGGLEGVVAGKVIKCEKHPNADRLKLTSIDLGNNQISEIVCGAPNIKEGQIVPVAIVGSKIYTKDGTEIKIKKSKIRGVFSNGMVCAEDEIGLGNSHVGIMVLDKKIKPGTPISEVFNINSDNILDIDLTPNRCDAMSHYGVARDLNAYYNFKSIKSKLTLPSVSNFESLNFQDNLDIKIYDTNKCPYYSGLVIKDINVTQSSKEIQDKLKSIGLKPINNIVDITNFVMHEIGQPLHAFDYDKIENINVKSLKLGTKFKTLDNEEIKLDDDDLMICSKNKPLCIAGIYGGLDSSVSKLTKNLFLESAIFDSITIRKSSKRHQLFTDASYRYERGVDPEKVLYALKRAAMLIKKDNPDCQISNIKSIDNLKHDKKEIYLRYNEVERVCGQSIDKEAITKILISLDFEITVYSDDGLKIIAPDYRHDVYREIDVIEEILRVFGFDSIGTKSKISILIPENGIKNRQSIESLITDGLVGVGFNEIINNSICSPEINKIFNKKVVKILNPQGVELSNLRVSLIPNLLDTIKHNINRQSKNLKLFEIGNTYTIKAESYRENKKLIFALVGEVFEENWISSYSKNNFYYLKGVLQNILRKLHISDLKYEVDLDGIFEYKLKISENENYLGFIGELNKDYIKNFSIENKVHICNLNLDNIKLNNRSIKYQESSRYPSSRRDLSMILDNNVSFDTIKDIAFKLENKILRNVNLFDVYKGENIAKKKKSLAISFTFNDSKKTLTDKLVDKIMKKISDTLKSELGAEIREK